MIIFFIVISTPLGLLVCTFDGSSVSCFICSPGELLHTLKDRFPVCRFLTDALSQDVLLKSGLFTTGSLQRHFVLNNVIPQEIAFSLLSHYNPEVVMFLPLSARNRSLRAMVSKSRCRSTVKKLRLAGFFDISSNVLVFLQ